MSWEPGETISLADFRGFIQPYAGASAPTGWLLCDGGPVSRATYSGLFSLIGTTYGVGDGSTTFNVPNLKGRFPLGYADTAPTKIFTFASRSGNTITITGADNHALNELQTGQAVLYDTSSGAIGGLVDNTTYYLIRVSYNQFNLATTRANANAGTAITLSSNGSGSQTFTITNTARPLGQGGGEEAHPLTSAELPANSPLTFSTQTNTGSPDPALEGVASFGGGQPHNNMPPFTVINYIIKT